MSSRTQKNLKAPAARASGRCGCCSLPFQSTRSRLARRSDVAINFSTKTGFTHFRSLVMPRPSGESKAVMETKLKGYSAGSGQRPTQAHVHLKASSMLSLSMIITGVCDT
ncbi:hypothetical protein SRHO_G00219720 [Serrasalmus rhombeus]